MVCGVGLSAPASCAAIRCAISNFQETRFMDSGGEWIMGSSVPLEKPWRSISKLAKMLASVLKECVISEPHLTIESVPVLLCLAESGRPGRFHGLDNQILKETQKELQATIHSRSRIFPEGRIGLATVLHQARKLLYDANIEKVIIAGTDSLLVGPSLRTYEERERLLTKENSNGFIPGEAASAVIVQKPMPGDAPQLVCTGIGEGRRRSNCRFRRYAFAGRWNGSSDSECPAGSAL